MTDQQLERALSSVFELFPLYRKMFLNSLMDLENELTRTQIFVLMALVSHSKITMSQTALLLASSKEQATRVVAPLVELGFVERIFDCANRRAVYIQLSDEGRAHILNLKKQMVKHFVLDNDVLTKSEMETLDKSIANVVKIFKKIEDANDSKRADKHAKTAALGNSF